MLRKLRHKFIAIAMCSIAAVLFLIMASINIANYMNVCKRADSRITMISDNGGHLTPGDRDQPQNVDASMDISQDSDASTDTTKRGTTPGVTDSVDTKDSLSETDDNNKISGTAGNDNASGNSDSDHKPDTAAPDKPNKHNDMSPEAAFDTRFFTVTLSDDGTVDQIDTGKIAAVSSSTAGEYASSLYARNNTHGFIDCYRYQLVSTDNTQMYIFVNCERELGTFRSFLLASAGISVAGLFVVYLLVVFFSKKIMQPVAESYEKQKRFITDASHEIKTPLTIIDANTEVLEMTGGENQWTKSIRKQIARLTSLTEKLVFLSRMDEESTQLEMEPFAISDAILDTADPFLAVATSRGKELSIDIDPDLVYKGNEGSIRQLVSLLLDNAIKYSTDDGQIRLSFHTRGRNLVLSVWNTVENIEPGRHDELFERFYRADKSRNQKTGGFGIGLSVVSAIVRAHKAKISALSEDGHSLNITIIL